MTFDFAGDAVEGTIEIGGATPPCGANLGTRATYSATLSGPRTG